jgi:formate dehydrogenase subunit delta
MTTVENLVRMINQIAENLAHEPDPIWAVAHHIELFWDPRMKRLLRENGSAGLSETAAAALERLTHVGA